MNKWVWVLSYTILGSSPEHVTLEKFESKEECLKAAAQVKVEQQTKKKEVVASCFMKIKANSASWW